MISYWCGRGRQGEGSSWKEPEEAEAEEEINTGGRVGRGGGRGGREKRIRGLLVQGKRERGEVLRRVMMVRGARETRRNQIRNISWKYRRSTGMEWVTCMKGRRLIGEI